ncbi:MAG TPA: 16S rRNA (uracil(1498)-N(3))-methyltransferase [Steroidobacteraceae bacterium]|nr:16S rRNA (uracil(1498)-N(3))-methyltransferase [Steroidobacteraceae bacterium]
MRVTRVYVERRLAPGARLWVGGATANHLARVLRLAPGAALTVFDGHGGEYEARIAELRKGQVQLALGERHGIERESPLEIVLAQGISRSERMDLVVQKATELGVARIAPVITERSVVRLDARQAEKRLRHWQAIAIAACEQCGRNRLPQIAAPQPLAALLGEPAGSIRRLVLSPAATLRVRDVRPADSPLQLLIGPEGGLSDAEHAAALAAGFRALQLGPRILRTETAALAALAALQQAHGDL